jgi:hypothetical protein
MATTKKFRRACINVDNAVVGLRYIQALEVLANVQAKVIISGFPKEHHDRVIEDTVNAIRTCLDVNSVRADANTVRH